MRNKYIRAFAALLFWIAVWQILSMIVRQKILLPSPLDTCLSFLHLVITMTFWKSVSFTVGKIVLGFLSALVLAVLLVVISSASAFAKAVIRPFMTALKSVPVASFVILALIWIDSSYLSAFISFVMVLPVIYINVSGGIDSCTEEMKEMAKVYNMSALSRALYIYVPCTLSHFKAACKVALGLCWKAGVAAELIGIPAGSVGERLYFSKVYFETSELFAWTLVIILISITFEKIFIFLLERAVRIYERI